MSPISRHRKDWTHRSRPMSPISGHFVASGGVRISFKSHLNFTREGIELRSKKDRTINARLSPSDRPTSDSLYVYYDELQRPSGNQTVAGR
ncbi:hypothetical protein DPMN_165654 [Dreissena polymorpha]|uniref:Uncharacterized protein n=1 Tax=Dreissena polymorpha TaxID=45954 RepID=A0A9D4F0P1_DREPO|nr:hypothetical protein DPMN_165654 [Dreissena polymorpha]